MACRKKVSEMPKISDFESKQFVTDDDLFLVESANGSRSISGRALKEDLKKISSRNEYFDLVDSFMNARDRVSIGGRNIRLDAFDKDGPLLPTVYDGSFKGFFLGDYWVIDGNNWRIVDMDYWYLSGDPPHNMKHHLVIMPDYPYELGPMNDLNNTEGGYANSKMFLSGLDGFIEKITELFGSNHIYSIRNYLPNAVTDGRITGGAWYSRLCDIPSLEMIIGSEIEWTSGTDKTQLSLFKNNSVFIRHMMIDYWTRTPIKLGTGYFAISAAGNVTGISASVNKAVRPVFALI